MGNQRKNFYSQSLLVFQGFIYVLVTCLSLYVNNINDTINTHDF